MPDKMSEKLHGIASITKQHELVVAAVSTYNSILDLKAEVAQTEEDLALAKASLAEWEEVLSQDFLRLRDCLGRGG